MPGSAETGKRKTGQHLSADHLAGSHEQMQILLRRADPYSSVVGRVYAAHTGDQRADDRDPAVVCKLEEVAERVERSARARCARSSERESRRALTVAAKYPGETAGHGRLESYLAMVIQPGNSGEEIIRATVRS